MNTNLEIIEQQKHLDDKVYRLDAQVMLPYYEQDGITIHNADCRTAMRALRPSGVIVITDPPYNAKNIGPNERTYSEGQMQLPEKEYKRFCKDWYKEASALADTILFTPGIANTHFYPSPKWQICWHKPAAVSFNRMGGFNAWEPIFVYGNTKHVRLGQDYIKANTLNFNKGPEKDHPCPKPMHLWKFLVEKFSKDDSVILDPFMGSGTTLVAAKSLGRKAIGIEMNENYCKIAVKRLNAVQQTMKFTEAV